MDRTSLRRSFSRIPPVAVLSALLLLALTLMNAATQNSEVFGKMYSLLLLINLVGIAVLLGLIGFNLYRLLVQYRMGEMGSRLTLRLFVMTVLLSTIPVSIVFFFSLQAINRGIDSWFDVKVERALDDALLLGRTALDATKQDLVNKGHDMANQLSGTSNRLVVPTLNYLREQYNVSELALFTAEGRVIGFSAQTGPETDTLSPDPPSEAIRAQIRRGLTYANLDPMADGELRLRVVVPVYPRDVGAPLNALQILEPLPNRYANLGQSVQSAFAEYEKLVYLRGPLKFGFTLTLSLVALVTVLLSLWASIVAARRVAAPLRDLAAGTAAVAAGNYRTRLPVPGNDEVGVLVKSFNEMTRRIHEAQTEVKRGQREAEMQRTYLETVLTHLSSGVLSYDARHNLRTYNAAANHILGVDLERGLGKGLGWISQSDPLLGPLAEILEENMKEGAQEWQADVLLQRESERMVLMVRGSRLPGLRGRLGGHVIVFDNMTTLIQAQRDAAWAEVARRLAHEIKNPLTPIQLSAERIRQKCMDQLQDKARDTLDRSTRTIVDQVDSLKRMVNAFSSYARPVAMQTTRVDINGLVRDVADMYRGESTHPRVELDLAERLPILLADPGRLRQVLHNLLLNAGDALGARKDARVHIRTRLVGAPPYRQLELEVQDNGPGFPEALMDRLFEPYVTSKEKGTGLGLAIVKKIVEEHNGSLIAANNDTGACVTLRLPLDQEVDASHGQGKSRKHHA
jgi:nitrogen fixation/metabolism regulation signal transduction histidine kinase